MHWASRLISFFIFTVTLDPRYLYTHNGKLSCLWNKMPKNKKNEFPSYENSSHFRYEITIKTKFQCSDSNNISFWYAKRNSMSIEKEGRRKFFESAYRMKLTTGFYVLLFGLTTILTFCKAKQVGKYIIIIIVHRK